MIPGQQPYILQICHDQACALSGLIDLLDDSNKEKISFQLRLRMYNIITKMQLQGILPSELHIKDGSMIHIEGAS